MKRGLPEGSPFFMLHMHDNRNRGIGCSRDRYTSEYRISLSFA